MKFYFFFPLLLLSLPFLASCTAVGNHYATGHAPTASLTVQNASFTRMFFTHIFTSRSTIRPIEIDGKRAMVHFNKPVILDAGHHVIQVQAVGPTGNWTTGFVEMDLLANHKYALSGRVKGTGFALSLRDITSVSPEQLEEEDDAAGTVVKTYQLNRGADREAITQKPGTNKMIE